MAEAKSKLRHVAIIMDGNGRWARERGLERSAGHRQGAEQVRVVLEAAQEFGLEYLTLYAFSTENWKRPPQEVLGLMNLLSEFLDRQLPQLMERKIRLKTLGRTDGLPEGPRRKLLQAIAATAENRGGTLVLALNYGGRAELVDAARKLGRAVAAGKVNPETLDEQKFRDFLYDPEIPDPDLLIRTSGELRLSNFLLWQLAYSELYVTPVLWPDFGRNELAEAIAAYGRRDRRFGGIKS